jgi:hypothetical protein
VTGRSGGSSPPRLLHHLAALLALAARKRDTYRPPGSRQRRHRQRLELMRRLMDPLPEPLSPLRSGGERFWRGLRWGGMGLLAGLWLSR